MSLYSPKDDHTPDVLIDDQELERLGALETGRDVTYEGKSYFVVKQGPSRLGMHYALLDAKTYKASLYFVLQNKNNDDAGTRGVEVVGLPIDFFRAFIQGYQFVEENFEQPQLNFSEIEFLQDLQTFPIIYFNKNSYTCHCVPYPDGTVMFSVNLGSEILLGLKWNKETKQFLAPPRPSVDLLKKFIKECAPVRAPSHAPKQAQKRNGA